MSSDNCDLNRCLPMQLMTAYNSSELNSQYPKKSSILWLIEYKEPYPGIKSTNLPRVLPGDKHLLNVSISLLAPYLEIRSPFYIGLVKSTEVECINLSELYIHIIGRFIVRISYDISHNSVIPLIKNQSNPLKNQIHSKKK